jgi:hypothetical protein
MNFSVADMYVSHRVSADSKRILQSMLCRERRWISDKPPVALFCPK